MLKRRQGVMGMRKCDELIFQTLENGSDACPECVAEEEERLEEREKQLMEACAHEIHS